MMACCHFIPVPVIFVPPVPYYGYIPVPYPVPVPVQCQCCVSATTPVIYKHVPTQYPQPVTSTPMSYYPISPSLSGSHSSHTLYTTGSSLPSSPAFSPFPAPEESSRTLSSDSRSPSSSGAHDWLWFEHELEREPRLKVKQKEDGEWECFILPKCFYKNLCNKTL